MASDNQKRKEGDEPCKALEGDCQHSTPSIVSATPVGNAGPTFNPKGPVSSSGIKEEPSDNVKAVQKERLADAIADEAESNDDAIERQDGNLSRWSEKRQRRIAKKLRLRLVANWEHFNGNDLNDIILSALREAASLETARLNWLEEHDYDWRSLEMSDQGLRFAVDHEMNPGASSLPEQKL